MVNNYKQEITKLNKEKAELASSLQIKEIEEKMAQAENDHFADILKKTTKNFTINSNETVEDYNDLIKYLNRIEEAFDHYKKEDLRVNQLLKSEGLNIDNSIQFDDKGYVGEGDISFKARDMFIHPIKEEYYNKIKILRKTELANEYLNYYSKTNQTIIEKFNIIAHGNDKLKGYLKRNKEKLDDLETAKDKIEDKNKKLGDLISGLTDSINNLSKLKEEYTKKIDNLMVKLNSQVEINRVLNSNLNKRKKEISKIREEFEERKRMYDEVTDGSSEIENDSSNIENRSDGSKSLAKRKDIEKKIQEVLR
eukprot:CAMPEP_0170520298 /NCGR_PEP_ID=MMETSP0209-20121228/5560_1 /TAXON_ID=665100 ORGANISM="Litonotus pictus, Strain P1" /NCGR_SAMPLE_ID=MMETSP0209 /ASSEMBLY_ACC=CAM_ASM_000301 /LENGTH=308 /DNA_ID=CAMNT_0010806509 /DNA_START=349 /DNA_END=1272 /DNA_ORIENTATION=-